MNLDLAYLPQTEVSWRDAIQFCNGLFDPGRVLAGLHDLAPRGAVADKVAPTQALEADDWVVAWGPRG